jgi:hypothetical protein
VHFNKFIHSVSQFKKKGHTKKPFGFNPLQQADERALDYPFLYSACAFGIL